MAEWQSEVKKMHERHRSTAKRGHADVLQLDQGSSDLQERELQLTMCARNCAAPTPHACLSQQSAPVRGAARGG